MDHLLDLSMSMKDQTGAPDQFTSGKSRILCRQVERIFQASQKPFLTFLQLVRFNY